MKSSESPFCSCLYFATSSLARKVEKLATGIWKQVDLSPSHAYVLILVLKEPGIQPGIVADQLQLTPSTITRLIEKLEERKLVVRTTEGKQTNVYPTQKAKAMRTRLRDCMEQFNALLTGTMGRENSKKFIRSVNEFADRLER